MRPAPVTLLRDHHDVPTERRSFDHDAHEARIGRGGCFICDIVNSQESHYREHIVYRDDDLVAVLSQPPVQRGYLLVAPLRHAEQVVTDFDLDEYLRIQTFVYHLGQALPKVLPVERLYVLSLGSQQGNAHVHWHVVPLPPGVPLSEQQFHSVMLENGYLDLSQEEQAELASRIKLQIEATIAAAKTG